MCASEQEENVSTRKRIVIIVGENSPRQMFQSEASLIGKNPKRQRSNLDL